MTEQFWLELEQLTKYYTKEELICINAYNISRGLFTEAGIINGIILSL